MTQIHKISDTPPDALREKIAKAIADNHGEEVNHGYRSDASVVLTAIAPFLAPPLTDEPYTISGCMKMPEGWQIRSEFASGGLKVPTDGSSVTVPVTLTPPPLTPDASTTGKGETANYSHSVCYYCRGTPHAIKDCPACQDLETTRELLLNEGGKLIAMQQQLASARAELAEAKAKCQDRKIMLESAIRVTKALRAQVEELRHRLVCVQEWAKQDHVMQFDDGDISVQQWCSDGLATNTSARSAAKEAT